MGQESCAGLREDDVMAAVAAGSYLDECLQSCVHGVLKIEYI
jgi:hypothetical protein